MKNPGRYHTLKDWLHIFQQAQAQGGRLLPLAGLCRISGLTEPAARKALTRLEAKGLVARVGTGLYSSSIFPAGLEEIAMAVGRPCYVSFESVLSRHGVLSQSPMVLTCATRRKPGHLKTPAGEILFRHISSNLFYGFKEEQGILWAEPEKALLDWLYWNAKTQGKIPDMDELAMEELDHKKLMAWSSKYPRTIQKAAASAIQSND